LNINNNSYQLTGYLFRRVCEVSVQWRQRLPYFGGGWADLGAKRQRVSRGWGMGRGIPLSREGVSPSGPPPANYVSGGAS